MGHTDFGLALNIFEVRVSSQNIGVYLSVKTSFSLFSIAVIFLGSMALTSQLLLCIHCFMLLVSFTNFYTEDEPKIVSNSSLHV